MGPSVARDVKITGPCRSPPLRTGDGRRRLAALGGLSHSAARRQFFFWLVLYSYRCMPYFRLDKEGQNYMIPLVWCHLLQRKPLVSHPGMHHGPCMTRVSWCMSRSPTCDGEENVPGIPRIINVCVHKSIPWKDTLVLYSSVESWCQLDDFVYNLPAQCIDYFHRVLHVLVKILTSRWYVIMYKLAVP